MLSAFRALSSSGGEQQRLAALDRYDILDTPSEQSFDRITRLVCRLFGVSMSTISFIDGHRQWFKSRRGIHGSETSREPALCNHAIMEERALVIPDTLKNPIFAQNQFVVGEPFIRFYAGVPLRTPEGHAIGTLCAIDKRPRAFSNDELETLTDLAQIVMSELELRLLISTDSLTNALSRRAFRDEANRAISSALRHGHGISGVIFDIDHFKSINDRYGHAMGDIVLSRTVEVCRTVLRKSDALGRLGGEEFAALLSHATGPAAFDVAEKMRRAIASQVFEAPAGPFSISASFGIAQLDRSSSGIDELLRRADTALYAAKAGGRNRCVEWQNEVVAEPNFRRRVFKAGSIMSNTGDGAIDCTVRSLSDSGASLDVIDAAEVPATFELRIEADETARMCRIVRQESRSLEVEFQ